MRNMFTILSRYNNFRGFKSFLNDFLFNMREKFLFYKRNVL